MLSSHHYATHLSISHTVKPNNSINLNSTIQGSRSGMRHQDAHKGSFVGVSILGDDTTAIFFSGYCFYDTFSWCRYQTVIFTICTLCLRHIVWDNISL